MIPLVFHMGFKTATVLWSNKLVLPPISDPPGMLSPVKCSFFSYSQFCDNPCLAIDSVFIGRFCDAVIGKIIGAFKKTAQKHKAQQISISSSLLLKKGKE